MVTTINENGNNSMSIKEITDKTLANVDEIVGGQLSAEQSEAVAKVIEMGILKAAVRMSENCQRYTIQHSGPEADIAHKINEEINRRREALLANLSGLR